MSIIKELNITAGPTLINVGSKSGDGKTSFLISVTKEFLAAGKSILVVTDDSPKIWLEKLSLKHTLNGKVQIIQLNDYKNLNELVKDRSFDCLILDCIYFSAETQNKEVENFAKSNNLITFTSFQLNRPAQKLDKSALMDSIKKLNRADMILTLTKKKEFTWFQRLKYFLFPFWFKKPNLTINVVKNRRGKEKSMDVAMDFGMAVIS